MQIQPPFQHKGWIIYSVEGLIQYCRYFIDQLDAAECKADFRVKAEYQSKINKLERKIKSLETEESKYKKEYLKLKNRARIKHDVYLNPNTGVKVLIPVNNPKGERSPKKAVESLKNTLQQEMYQQEKWRSEDDGYKKWREHEERLEGVRKFLGIGKYKKQN